MDFSRLPSIRTVLITLLIALFMVTSVTDVYAKRKSKKRYRAKRSYNPQKTKAEALEIIKANPTLSAIAGVEFVENAALSSDAIKVLNENEEVLTEDGEYGEDLAELAAEDDVTVDLEEFKRLWLQYVDDGYDSMTDYGVKSSDLMDAIMQWLGTPYRFGGTTKSAIDCSAFTQKIFLSSADILLPRVAREQVNVGKKINRNKLKFGDLIFFHTYSRRFASHVGIYLGDGLFAHAGSKFGVTVSSLESTYYKNRFIGGRRLSLQDMANLSITKENTYNASVQKQDTNDEEGDK